MEEVLPSANARGLHVRTTAARGVEVDQAALGTSVQLARRARSAVAMALSHSSVIVSPLRRMGRAPVRCWPGSRAGARGRRRAPGRPGRRTVLRCSRSSASSKPRSGAAGPARSLVAGHGVPAWLRTGAPARPAQPARRPGEGTRCSQQRRASRCTGYAPARWETMTGLVSRRAGHPDLEVALPHPRRRRGHHRPGHPRHPHPPRPLP